MASILYREGDSHEVNGIKCEIGLFDGAEVGYLLTVGWVADPKELAKPKAKESGSLPDDKDELERIGREFGVELDKRKSVANLKKQVQELVDGHKD